MQSYVLQVLIAYMQAGTAISRLGIPIPTPTPKAIFSAVDKPSPPRPLGFVKSVEVLVEYFVRIGVGEEGE